MARLVEPTADLVWHVLDNLRLEDKREFEALLPSGPAGYAAVAASVLAAAPLSWVAVGDDGIPIAVIGANRFYEGVAVVFAFGTKDWGKVRLLLTRHVLRYMKPILKSFGFHRAECTALSNREDIQRWMTVLGGRPEAVLRQRSQTREDVTVYVWTADDVEAPGS